LAGSVLFGQPEEVIAENIELCYAINAREGFLCFGNLRKTGSLILHFLLPLIPKNGGRQTENVK